MKKKKLLKKVTLSSIALIGMSSQPMNVLAQAIEDKEKVEPKNPRFKDETEGQLKIYPNETELNQKEAEALQRGFKVTRKETNLGNAVTNEELRNLEQTLQTKTNESTQTLTQSILDYDKVVEDTKKENQKIQEDNQKAQELYQDELQKVEQENARRKQEYETKLAKYNADKQAYETEKKKVETENNKALEQYNQQLTQVQEENARINTENEKLTAQNQVIRANNERIKQENKTAKDNYLRAKQEAEDYNNRELQNYRNEFDKFKNQEILALKDSYLLGTFGARGKNYYDDLKYFVHPNHVRDTVLLKTGVFKGSVTLENGNIPQRFIDKQTSDGDLWLKTFNNELTGKHFFYRNAFDTTDGRLLDLKITINGTEPARFDYSDSTRLYFVNLKTGGLAIDTNNLNLANLTYSFIDSKTKQPVKVGTPLLFGDVDYEQGFRVYGNSTKMVKPTHATDIGYRNINGNQFIMSTIQAGVENFDSSPNGTSYGLIDPSNNGEFTVDYRQIKKDDPDYPRPTVHEGGRVSTFYYEIFVKSIKTQPIGYRSIPVEPQEKPIETEKELLPLLPEPKKPSPKRPTITDPETIPNAKPTVEYLNPPTQPTDKPLKENPPIPTVELEHFFFTYQPQAQKFIIDLEGNDLHNKLIFKNSSFNYVLTPPILAKDRAEIEKIIFEDTIPEGLEFSVPQLEKWEVEQQDRNLIFTLKQSELDKINADRTKEYEIQPITITATAKNDAAIYLNNAEFKMISKENGNPPSEYRDTTKIVLVGTPGEKTIPNNPNNDPNEPVLPQDSKTNPNPTKQVVTPSNEIQANAHHIVYELKWSMKPYQNISTIQPSQDLLSGLSGLVDYYSENLSFVEIIDVKDSEGIAYNVNDFTVVTYKNKTVLSDPKNIALKNPIWEKYDFGNQYSVIVPINALGEPILPNYQAGKDLIFTVKMKYDNKTPLKQATNHIAQYDRGNGYLGNHVDVTPTGKIQYEFISGTPNETLDNEVIQLTPNDNTEHLYGETLNPNQVFDKEKVFENYKWVFDSFDKNEEVIDGGNDKFTGTWYKYGKIVHQFMSNTLNETLPLDVLKLVPNVPNFIRYLEKVNPTDPIQKSVNDGEYQWRFNSYDKSNEILDGVTDIFTGSWEKYGKAKYEFISGTPNETLPESVKALTPSDKDFTRFTETVTPQVITEEVPDGESLWKFKSWDKPTDIIDGDDTFVGTWVKLGKPTYEFISETPNEILPQEVMELLPQWNKVSVEYGTSVSSDKLDKIIVSVSNGQWVFRKFDKETEVIDGKDDKFIGKWIKQNQPTYKFISNIPNKPLPQKVLDLLPKEIPFEDYGKEIPVVDLPTKEINVSNGKWVFNKWNKDKDMIDGNDEFIGEWVFVENTKPIPNTNDTTTYSIVGLGLSLLGLMKLRKKNQK